MIASVTTSALLATAVPPQATLNAALNALAGVLLVIGYVLIRRRRETAHKRTMLAAFVVSVLFLTSYLTYHYQSNWTETKFQGPLPLRNWLYYPLLVSHVILAAMVPVLARAAIAVGVAAVFMETHQDPDSAPSDGPNMVKLQDIESILATLMEIDSVMKTARREKAA